MKSHSLQNSIFLILFPIFILISMSCINQEQQEKTGLTLEEEEKVRSEIISAVDNYNKAITSNDLDRMLEFWSDSEDFIHAGDGIVVGGYEEWANWMKEWYNPNRKWLYWKGSNVNTVVLSKEAAVYTYNFEDAYVDGIDTTRVNGAWTFVFRKENSKWKVIASNGTHEGISY